MYSIPEYMLLSSCLKDATLVPLKEHVIRRSLEIYVPEDKKKKKDYRY